MTEAAAKKQKRAPDLKAVPTDKPKRTRKAGGDANTFAGQLRELARKHRSKLSKLTTAETKLEGKLAAVRAQRLAAEGPLRQVEEMLAKRPELPGLESAPAPESDAPPGDEHFEGEVRQ